MANAQTLDQERAAYAWEVTSGADSELKRIASGAPSLIMSNGLMQALAFLQHKGQQKLMRPVLRWLGTKVFNMEAREATFDAVIEKLSKSSAEEYFRATEEALAILAWIRQFAKARVKEDR